MSCQLALIKKREPSRTPQNSLWTIRLEWWPKHAGQELPAPSNIYALTLSSLLVIFLWLLSTPELWGKGCYSMMCTHPQYTKPLSTQCWKVFLGYLGSHVTTSEMTNIFLNMPMTHPTMSDVHFLLFWPWNQSLHFTNWTCKFLKKMLMFSRQPHAHPVQLPHRADLKKAEWGKVQAVYGSFI